MLIRLAPRFTGATRILTRATMGTAGDSPMVTVFKSNAVSKPKPTMLECAPAPLRVPSRCRPSRGWGVKTPY